MLSLEACCSICHAKGIPVVVDAASEYDLRGFLARGADLVVYSGQKFLGGPTSGIVAGAQSLVHAASLQNRGIGRTMKVRNESIAGVMAALQAWMQRVVRGGGEGLMLHKGRAPYRSGRSDDLLKLKPFEDAEAQVLSHVPGTGLRTTPHRAEVSRCVPLPAPYAFRSPARFTGNNGNAGPSVAPAAEAGALPPVNAKPFAHLRGVIG